MCVQFKHPVLVVMLYCAVSAASAQEVGSVAAVNPQSTGQAPRATAPRTLSLGANVVHRERVRTSSEGSLQISFQDRTTLNVGRNSEVVIDEFVYNPSAGAGRLTASLAKGVLRFVGGQVSHTGEATIRTLTAAIGIRGGVGTIAYAAGLHSCGGALVVHHFGTMTVRNNVSQVAIRRSGYAVCAASANQPISDPFPVSDVALGQLTARLASGPGQRGGAVRPPNDQMAARLGVTPARLPTLNSAPGAEPFTRTGIFAAGDALVRNHVQSGQRGQPAAPPAPAPPPPPPPPSVD